MEVRFRRLRWGVHIQRRGEDCHMKRLLGNITRGEDPKEGEDGDNGVS